MSLPPTEMASVEEIQQVSEALLLMSRSSVGLFELESHDTDEMPRRYLVAHVGSGGLEWRTGWHTPIQALLAWLRDERRRSEEHSRGARA